MPRQGVQPTGEGSPILSRARGRPGLAGVPAEKHRPNPVAWRWSGVAFGSTLPMPSALSPVSRRWVESSVPGNGTSPWRRTVQRRWLQAGGDLKAPTNDRGLPSSCPSISASRLATTRLGRARRSSPRLSRTLAGRGVQPSRAPRKTRERAPPPHSRRRRRPRCSRSMSTAVQLTGRCLLHLQFHEQSLERGVVEQVAPSCRRRPAFCRRAAAGGPSCWCLVEAPPE
jgi:hypothetical protein